MRVTRRPRAVAALVASALAFGLYSRMEWPWLVLGWVALVPWLAVLDEARSLRGALAAGVVMACLFELTVFGWFARAVETYTDLPWIALLALLVVLAPLLQPQFVMAAAARHLARAHGASPSATTIGAVVGALVYVGTEWAIPKLFADTLGHGLYPSLWLRQAADVAGAHGLTVVVILANECALAAWRAPFREQDATLGRKLAAARVPAACMIGLIAMLATYGAVRSRAFHGSAAPLAREDGTASAPSTGARPAGDIGVTAGVVQANISHYDRLREEIGTYEAVRRILDAHFALSGELLRRAPLDLLVWPETVYPTTFGAPKSDDGARFDREIASFVAESRVPLIFGSYDAEADEEFNAAVFLPVPSAGRLVFDTYRKAALFPLTERVPAFLDSETVRRWLPWLGTWKRGAGSEVVSLALADGRALRIAPLICYDVLDPRLALAAVARGADLLVTLSNDSWFDEGRGPRMHLVGAAFLSIETRRPQIRATNTGISAIIDANGTLVATAGVGERATLLASVVPGQTEPTLIVRWGEWLGPVALAAGLILAGRGVIGRRRTGSRR